MLLYCLNNTIDHFGPFKKKIKKKSLVCSGPSFIVEVNWDPSPITLHNMPFSFLYSVAFIGDIYLLTFTWLFSLHLFKKTQISMFSSSQKRQNICQWQTLLRKNVCWKYKCYWLTLYRLPCRKMRILTNVCVVFLCWEKTTGSNKLTWMKNNWSNDQFIINILIDRRLAILV